MIDRDKSNIYDILAGKIFAVFLVINSTNLFIKTIWPESILTDYLTVVLGLFFWIYYIRKTELFRCTFGHIVILDFILFVLVMSSILRYPEAASAIEKRSLWVFAFCVPFFVISRNVKSLKVFVEQTFFASIIVSAFGMLLYLFIRRYNISTTYIMPFSYMMLFPTLLHILQLERKKYLIILVLAEIFTILILGSRGAVFCILAFLGMRFLFSRINTVKTLFAKFLFFTITLIVVGFLYTYADTILKELWLSDYSSRTLNLLLRGDALSHDSGRSFIYQMIWDRIMEKPLLGWGICGQLSFMNTYSHSIFLDLLLEYGILVGGFLAVAIVVLLIRGIYKSGDNIQYFLLFLCAGFIPLLVSGTYLQAPIFWFAMGLTLPVKNYLIIRMRFRN